MIDLLKSGGWLMIPIILCSIIAMTIALERFWSLRKENVLPKGLLNTLHQWAESGQIPELDKKRLAVKSPLGRVVVAGIDKRYAGWQRIRESVEETGRQVVHEMERFLNTLGTIAAISPLLGLLGTVFGMIEVFSTLSEQGAGNAVELAGGISQALITTAAGLTVAIPSLFLYRYFNSRVEALVIRMEKEAMNLISMLHSAEDKRN